MPTDEQRWATLPRCPYCNEKGTHAPQCAEGAAPRRHVCETTACCATFTAAEWAERAAPRAEGLDVERLREIASEVIEAWRSDHPLKDHRVDSAIRQLDLALRLSRPSDERVPESEET